jgi:hypothetical protein
LINTVLNAIKSQESNFRSEGEQLVRKLSEGFSSGKSAFESAVKDTISNSARGIDTNVFYSVGENLAKGIQQGFLSQESTIKANINAMINRIKASAEANQKIESPSKVWAEVGKYMALGLDAGFVGEMKNVTRDINNSIPTSANVKTNNSPSAYDSLVEAFKEALYGVKVEMDNEEMGRFIDKTVSNLIYT